LPKDEEVPVTEFAALSALDASRMMKDGELSPEDYVTGLAALIERRDPEVRAFAFFDREHAVAQAERLKSLDQEADLPLLGVPVAVKDIIDTADMPTENGTPLDAGRQPEADAAVIHALRKAGAIILGKTVTTELAFLSPSVTRNPRNLNHTPGGSSSGSAAAVAAGMTPVALGTQTNGSVIRPASFNGIYALKPTNGLFPRRGVLEEAGTLDTVGVFARSLTDVAAVAEVMAEGEGQALRPKPRLLSALGRASHGKFAFVKTPAWPQAEPATQQAFEKLARNLGAQCEEVTLPPAFDAAISLHRTIMMAEIALNFGRYYERDREALSIAVRAAIEEGREIKAEAYLKALREREKLRALYAQTLSPYAGVITPPAAGPAPASLESTGNPIFCTLWTFLGVPAINLPFLEIGGMPLGVQLAGQAFGEAALFSAAQTLSEKLQGLGYKDTSATGLLS
jgi:Asp-tRNA(Asn)/Glu-tRNA(Gln) amidotransferase A subunit family amidase